MSLILNLDTSAPKTKSRKQQRKRNNKRKRTLGDIRKSTYQPRKKTLIKNEVDTTLLDASSNTVPVAVPLPEESNLVETKQPLTKKRKISEKRELGPESKLRTIDLVRVVHSKKLQDEINTEQLDVFADGDWDNLDICDKLKRQLFEKMEFLKPTTIQNRAIPKIVGNKDVLVKAQTGSGKTLTYLIPIIQDLQARQMGRYDGSYALIISPTRELCLQIYEVLEILLRPWPHIVPGYIIGGEKRKSEKARLRKGISVLVATPGRLLDHLETSYAFKVNPLRWLILDEADRLLDMGFENTIRVITRILNERCSEERNNVLTSATLNKNVNRLALLSMESPVYVGVDETDNTEFTEYGTHEVPDSLTQLYSIVPLKKRLTMLAAFIRWKILTEVNCKMIVFMSNRAMVDYIFSLFSAVKFPKRAPVNSHKHELDVEKEDMIPGSFFKLHGDLPQNVRSETFFSFRESPSAVLICTDVAARGLDLPNVSWIVQYDAPSDPAAYIHRIGRTARIGHSGNALLFVLPSEIGYIDILKEKDMKFTELLTDDIMITLTTNLERNPVRRADLEMHNLQYEFQNIVESEGEIDYKSMAIKAYQTYVQSYATHTKSTKHIFHVRNLHLGHLSKSFALKELPTEFKRVLNSRKKEEKADKRLRPLKATHDSASEFSSGM
eukprot:TRINITY_DN6060_c0_g1_i3.p1 TRINITY_DN6060_c0_g1~~TRINITY_DN6060_c0_g1_i3.p1  ORF type:complete len:668 (-),score=129.06 TRINITY_DN6060_c0_g1_i3:97-2100(-)